MNALILLMLCLVLFDLFGVHEEIIANILCFVSGQSFDYYLCNLKKNRGLTKQLNDDLIFFIQKYNKNNVDIKNPVHAQVCPTWRKGFL